jgi:Aspartyl protease/PDZ domain
MLWLMRGAQALTLGLVAFSGSRLLAAQTQSQLQTAASILAQVREATGGEAWERITELRREGTVLLDGKTGTITTFDNLRTGANADCVDLQGVGRVENHADMPAQDWEQDEAGDVLLTPGGKEPADIDDLYIHRNGWWEPGFGGATVTLLPPATEEGVTYDLLHFKLPGGNGFTLWIDRPGHYIDRIASGDSATLLSDFRRTQSGLTLPFRKQKGTGKNAVVFTTTKLLALPSIDEADFKPPFHTDYVMPASGQVTVSAEGGLLFGMKINGQGPYNTVFDTGGVNILTTTFAKQLGLKVEEEPVHFGAIGGAITAHTTHVEALTIGDLVVRDQRFFVLDIPPGSGDPEMFVGWELMRRFAIRVDSEHNQLTFFDGPRFQYTGPGSTIPLILNKGGDGAEIRAEVDGIPGVFTLDTGNQTGLFLNSGFVQEHDLVVALAAHYRGYNGRGFGGPSPEAWFTRLRTLRIGDLEIAKPIVRLQTAPDGFQANAGNIGQSILNRFTLTVDCMRGVMYLEKTANSDKPEIFNRAGLILDPADGIDHVMTVLAGSPGEISGLRPGDSITAINGKSPADDPNDPTFNQAVGTVLHLTVSRNGVVRIYDVTLRNVL